MDKSVILLIPEKTDVELEQVFATWAVSQSGTYSR
jgi:hypothetical protein